MQMIKIILCLILLAPLAFADYHYASHEGTNEYPYTSWATATDSIQKALDAASPHDTVYIGSGDYYERVRVRRDSLAMIGMGMDSTRIWWDGYHQVVIYLDSTAYMADLMLETNPPYITSLYGAFFYRYTIERCHFEGGGGYVSGAGGHIRNCIFNGPLSSIGTPLTGLEYLEVSNCIFNTTETTPISSQADTNIIFNNIIYSEGVDGIFLGNGQIYNYIANNLITVKTSLFGLALYHTEPIVSNNTIDTLYLWQYETDAGIGLGRSGVPLTLLNNAITGGERGGIHLTGEHMTLNASYNNIWGTDRSFYMDDPSCVIDTSGGLLHEYPMFDKINGYRLQAFSPLIDAGDPDILDVDGSRSDIGCYGGPGGASYDYQDLPPLIPFNLAYELNDEDSTIDIFWHYNEEADFGHYIVYRDSVAGFEPSVFNQLAEPETSFYSDPDWPAGHNFYYRIAAADNQANLSDYSDELTVVITSIWDQPGVAVPRFTAITNNYPNPFNNSTLIVYQVANIGPIPAEIKIEIYDVLGRRVRTLVDERKEVGIYKMIWDGRNDNGVDLTSGVYFARIVQWGQRQLNSNRKLLLIR